MIILSHYDGIKLTTHTRIPSKTPRVCLPEIHYRKAATGPQCMCYTLQFSLATLLLHSWREKDSQNLPESLRRLRQVPRPDILLVFFYFPFQKRCLDFIKFLAWWPHCVTSSVELRALLTLATSLWRANNRS